MIEPTSSLRYQIGWLFNPYPKMYTFDIKGSFCIVSIASRILFLYSISVMLASIPFNSFKFGKKP